MIPLERKVPAPAVARAAGVTLETLKNYTRRMMLLYPGPEPRAGHPRFMPLYGAYEFLTLIELQRAGLSLEAARSVWRHLMERQFSRERAPKGADDQPMSFEEIQCNRASRWTEGANNEHPRTLPPFMTGDIPNEHRAVLSILADRFGRSSQFRVVLRVVTPEILSAWTGDPADLFAERAAGGALYPASPRELAKSILFFDFNRVIFNANARLFGGRNADDEAQDDADDEAQDDADGEG